MLQEHAQLRRSPALGVCAVVSRIAVHETSACFGFRSPTKPAFCAGRDDSHRQSAQPVTQLHARRQQNAFHMPITYNRPRGRCQALPRRGRRHARDARARFQRRRCTAPHQRPSPCATTTAANGPSHPSHRLRLSPSAALSEQQGHREAAESHNMVAVASRGSGRLQYSQQVEVHTAGVSAPEPKAQQHV